MNHPNSLKAYYDKDNQRLFNSHKAKIIRTLNKTPELSRFQLSHRLGINDHAIQKRLSDLKNEGKIEECGTTLHLGNECSLYKIKDQLKMFECPKKPILSKWLKNNYPSIYNEFKKL